MNDYTKQGWVRLYRKSLDSTVWESPVIWMVWCWCLLKATHQKRKFLFNGQDFELNEGEFITGRNKACTELPKVTPQQWRTAINYLKSTSRITIKSNNKFTVITIVKWDEHQKDNQLSNQRITNQQPTSNQPVTTYKNDNKDKNEKKATYMSANADAFESFWSSYPKKEQKKKTQEIWQRKHLDPYLSVILEFIKKASVTDRWKKGFIKMPTAFLTGECWNDDLSSYQDNRFTSQPNALILQ